MRFYEENIKAVLKEELERLNQELKEAASVYNSNRRKLKNRIAYEQLLAQHAELNRICIALNISLVNDSGKLYNITIIKKGESQMKGDLIMKETRKLNGGKVRAACIRYQWYTAGDCEEYDNMFDFIRTLTTATIDDLETVAADIKEHSDTEYEISDIMFVLANDCCITFFD